jgi:hypothetical protein
MTRECHVRICERLGVKLPGPTRLSPPGAQEADVYRDARSGYFVSHDKSPWQEVYARKLSASMRPGAHSVAHR